MEMKVDLTRLKPYGDTLDDGRIQLSFTLPVPDDDRAVEAARAILLSLGIQGCIDSALCHNRLRPLGGKGGHQLYRPAVFHSSQSSGKPCQPCTHDHQSVFHTLFHPI